MKFKDSLINVYREGTGFRSFLLSLIFIGVSYGLYKGIMDNYFASIASLNEFDRGVAEFFRELPGALLILILAALYFLTAQSIYRIGAILMLGGLACLIFVPSDKLIVILVMTVYSVGEHLQIGMKNTLSLDYAKPGYSGRALGNQNSIYNMGNVAGFLVVSLAFVLIGSQKTAFRVIYIVSFLFMVAGTAAAFKMGAFNRLASGDRKVDRFYFRKKFYKYYMLELFYGARKQVFFTFGPYVLILHYGASTTLISMLFAVSSLCLFVFSPVIGRIIDRFGYRIVMIMDTLILVIVCFFYGFADKIFPHDIALIVCCVNYILDSIISQASMASSVYVKDISDSPEEVRATITTGLSVNHFITILIALFGGWVWQALGIEMLFILSAVLGICNSIYAATIPTSGRHEPEKA